MITLAITGFSIIKVLIPLVIQGFNPMTVAIVICIVFNCGKPDYNKR